MVKKHEEKLRRVTEELDAEWKEKLEELQEKSDKAEKHHKAKLKKLEKELDVTIEGLKAEEAEGKARANDFVREIGRLNEQLERNDKHIMSLEEEKREVERKFEQSKRHVMEGQEAKEEKDKVSAELGIQKLEVQSLKEKVEGLKAKIELREKDKVEMEGELNEGREKLNALKTELESEREHNKTKLKELNAKHRSVLSQLANEKVATGKSEADSLKALKLNHNKMVAEKDKDIASSQAEVLALKESVGKLRAEKASSKLKSSAQWTKERKKLEDNIEKLEEERQKLKLESAKEEMTASENERLQKLLDETNDKLSSLNTNLGKLERERQTLESDIRTEREANAKLTREVKDKLEIIEEKEDEKKRLKKVIADKTGEMESLREAKDKVEDELHVKLERIKELGEQLDVQANDAGGAQAIFVQEEKKQAYLLRELDKAKMRIVELEREVAGLKEQLKKKERRGSQNEAPPSVLTKKDIKMVIKYIDRINDDNDGEISIEEFEKAMRQCRRARGCAEEFTRGRLLTVKLEQLVDAHEDLTLNGWFKQVMSQYHASVVEVMGTGPKGKDEKAIGTIALHEAIMNMHKGVVVGIDAEPFSSEEASDLIRFLDPNLDEHVSVAEFKMALRRAHLPANSLYAEFQCSIVMNKLENYMQDKHLRIKDVFDRIDKDHSGCIDLKEFEKGIKALVGLDRDNEDHDLSQAILGSSDEMRARFGTIDGEGGERNDKARLKSMSRMNSL
jgi:chromosome segregation ATPase